MELSKHRRQSTAEMIAEKTCDGCGCYPVLHEPGWRRWCPTCQRDLCRLCLPEHRVTCRPCLVQDKPEMGDPPFTLKEEAAWLAKYPGC